MYRLGCRRWVVLFVLLGTGALLGTLHLSFRGSEQGRLVEPAEPVAVAWVFEAKKPGAILSAPLVAGGRVYMPAIHSTALWNDGAVYCLDAATGKLLWQFDDGGKMQHTCSSPCLADGRLYLGEGMHANFTCKLYCLDAGTGRKNWDFTAQGHIESGPTAAGGKVFFGAGDDGLYALDAITGKERWHFRGPYHFDSSPAVSGQRLFAGSGVSRTHRTMEALCLSTRDAGIHWRFPTSLPVWGSPALAGDEVYFGLGNGRLQTPAPPPEKPAGALLCLSSETGQRRWCYNISDAVLTRPAVGPGRVYFGARDGNCYCLDRRTGELSWKQDLASPVMTNPALVGDRLYVIASAGRVCCLDADTGRIEWTFEVARHAGAPAQLYSSPAVISAAGENGPSRRIVFGAEIEVPGRNAAVVYCLRD
jgi:outer membrane protein assembly factor BamB